jgi:hypothetical protein
MLITSTSAKQLQCWDISTMWLCNHMCRIQTNPNNSEEMRTLLLNDLEHKHSSACKDQNLARCKADFGDAADEFWFFPQEKDLDFLKERARPLLDQSANGRAGVTGILDRATCDAVASASTAEQACMVVADRFLDVPNLIVSDMCVHWEWWGWWWKGGRSRMG